MLPLKHLLQYEDGITLQRAKKAVIGHKHLTPIYVVYLREIGDSNVQYEIVNGKLITETKHENINIDFKVKEAPVKVEKVKSIFDEEEF